MKGSQTRLDEIVNFIVAEVPGPERPAVRQFLNQQVGIITAGGAALRAISDSFSSHHFTGATGNRDQRAMRRALLLLQSIQNFNPGAINNISGMALGLLRAALDEKILALRYVADQSFGAVGVIRQVYLNRLKTNPLVFLASNKLHIFGSNTSGVTQSFFRFKYRESQFAIIPPPCTDHNPYRFDPVNIPAIPWDQVPGRTGLAPSFAAIDGTELTGADVMISTQFTGCSFCFKEHNGQFFAAHIMPDNGPAGAIPGSGIQLARELAGQEPTVVAGDFAAPAPAGGNFMVYGRGYSNILARPAGYAYAGPPSFMTIIGFCTGGTWRIYSQEVGVAGNVTGVYQIH